MNSGRWTWFAIGFMTLWAYAMSFIVYQLGTWATEGVFGSSQLMACAILAAIFYMLLRRNPHTAQQ